MLKAQAIAEAVAGPDPSFDDLAEEFTRLRKSLPLEHYFKVLDDFVDNARDTIAMEEDPEKREHLRSHYANLVEHAVDLACSPG